MHEYTHFTLTSKSEYIMLVSYKIRLQTAIDHPALSMYRSHRTTATTAITSN